MPSLNKKKSFVKGQKVWFLALDKIECGTIVWAYRGRYIVQNSHFLGARSLRELGESKDEAEQKFKAQEV